jgi:isochorismate synthase EntC
MLIAKDIIVQVVCKNVKVKSYKSVIKQANVQHLYGSLVGQLVDGNDEVCTK